MTTAKVLSIFTDDGKITLVYDKHCQKYTVQRIGTSGKVFETRTECSPKDILTYLEQHGQPTKDPMITVIKKAISSGVDPSTLYGVGDRIS